MAIGRFHSCAIADPEGLGELYCWGRNDHGQVGDGTNTARPTPVLVGTGFAKVSVGGYHTCGIKLGGQQVYCWGYGGDGALGTGAFSNRTAPTLVLATRTSAVIAGWAHTCVIDNDARGVRCTGHNGYGQLGDNSFQNRATFGGLENASGSPSLIAQSNVQQVVAGVAFTCIRKTNQVYCLGGGALGVPTYFFQPYVAGIPVAFANTAGPQGNLTTYDGVFELDGEFDTVCARKYVPASSLTRLFCWGRNDWMQIAGNMYNQPAPTFFFTPTMWSRPYFIEAEDPYIILDQTDQFTVSHENVYVWKPSLGQLWAQGDQRFAQTGTGASLSPLGQRSVVPGAP